MAPVDTSGRVSNIKTTKYNVKNKVFDGKKSPPASIWLVNKFLIGTSPGKMKTDVLPVKKN